MVAIVEEPRLLCLPLCPSAADPSTQHWASRQQLIVGAAFRQKGEASASPGCELQGIRCRYCGAELGYHTLPPSTCIVAWQGHRERGGVFGVGLAAGSKVSSAYCPVTRHERSEVTPVSASCRLPSPPFILSEPENTHWRKVKHRILSAVSDQIRTRGQR